MADTPNLVIQLQRMGDLVLSFPLFSWLAGLEPEHPVWVVAEPVFYEALMPLAPSVVFFPPQAEPRLRGVRFHRVINLSHRPEAARLAGGLTADIHLGAFVQNGETRINGAWQLYRASLVHNNRHNRFHWADLNALDTIPAVAMRRSVWPAPRPPAGTGRIGLFVGASEAAKRPEPEFWAKLAQQLMHRGCRPVFLGGEAEKTIGTEAARIASLPLSNLCGRFKLAELVHFLAELDMLVAPDTGPMHVGAWAGTLTLNLSMGPVNAWETAPFPPGHLILRPTTSCTGCWRCERNADAPPCKSRFIPERVASLIHSLLKNENRFPVLPGLSLTRTQRSEQGLFDMTFPAAAPLATGESVSLYHPDDMKRNGFFRQNIRSRDALGEFWKQWFLERLGGSANQSEPTMRELAELHPQALTAMRRAMPRLQARFASALRGGTIPADFWKQSPPLLRPLTGYLQLALENEDCRREAWSEALTHIESLATLLQA